MASEPENPNVEVGQSDEERHSIIEELQKMAPGEEAAVLHTDEDGPTAEEQFAALQAQGLGSGALGTDPYTR